MKYAHCLPVFSVAFILCYAVTVYFNLAMFTYMPATNSFYWFVPALAHAKGALPMFWYGWITTTLIPALAITAVFAFAPPLKDKTAWPALVWLSPLFAMVVVAYVLRIWFTM